jgi:hypothetical protein
MPLTRTVYIGTAVTSTVVFTNPGDSTPVDPSTVTLKFGLIGQPPTLWTYNGFGSITRALDANNNPYYYAEVLATGAGSMVTQWTGTGACAAVNFDDFLVSPPPF